MQHGIQNGSRRAPTTTVGLASGPCSIDKVYQGFVTGRLVSYLDAKLGGTGGHYR
jgi:hypothetical protein